MRRRTLAGLGVATALALGVIGTAALAETPPPSPRPATPSQPQGTGQNEVQEPSYTSSVRVAESATEDGAAEGAALTALAKISEADARNAALAKFPGATIQKAALEDENGSVVWAVELTDANKAAQEVKVDAGNATILAVEAGGAEGEKSGGKED